MNCQHTKTEIIPTPEGPHHGKIVCVDCRKFLGWAKKPQTIEREARNAGAIVKLRGLKLTPKQQAWLDALAAKYV